MFHLIIVLSYIAVVAAGPATESFKDQFCTDPRTMKKHAAYTEWADAYSCSRHRCQPGGRNLAIYTVGCKRVEAPESAIECEEVVEDTNMQFPYCCTRLRCLVVVRGEVWTRVLGQPWETLPAAPWSHMYKMKKPPPSDDHFGNKNIATGPVYEIQTDEEQKSHDKMLRSSKKVTTAPDCDEPSPRSAPAPAPDIVIALSTANDEKEPPKSDHKRHKRVKKPQPRSDVNEENRDHNEVDFEDTQAHDKLQDTSDEKLIDAFGVTQSIQSKAVWTDIPQSQWDEHDPAVDVESQRVSERNSDEKKKKEKPSGLQALVDAIGNRMKDIENVVQRMTEKVHNKLPEAEVASSEKRSERTDKHTHKADKENAKDDLEKAKQPNSDNEHYKRFTVKNRGSKYLHGATDVTSEQPLFVEDTNLNGYFSDASNSVGRRAGASKDPLPTYMAPVESRRKSHTVDLSGEDKKHKKHGHKKKRKNKGHKKHHVKDDKRKRFNKLSSAELDKNVVSLEDSGVL